MTQVVFGTAGVGRAIFRLFRACLHIRFHMWTRICYVIDLACRGKSLGNTHLDFLVCSSFLPLNNQTVVEILVDWAAPHYRSRRQKLAAENHTPTLLHINRRDKDSLRDRIYIPEA